MKSPLFRNTVLISLLGHLAVFGAFGFSFGDKIPQRNYPGIFFWGQVLDSSQVGRPLVPAQLKGRAVSFPGKVNTLALDSNLARGVASLSDYHLKPLTAISFSAQKPTLISKANAALPLSAIRKEPAIIFHPALPFNFILYFKDRQVAHVELMFKVESAGTRNSIIVKRKISSGNLEVDLLTMRYIGHYLFVRQASLTPDTWQTVKIDLSAKND